MCTNIRLCIRLWFIYIYSALISMLVIQIVCKCSCSIVDAATFYMYIIYYILNCPMNVSVPLAHIDQPFHCGSDASDVLVQCIQRNIILVYSFFCRVIVNDCLFKAQEKKRTHTHSYFLFCI